MNMLRRLPALVFVLVMISIVAAAIAQQNILMLLIAGAVAMMSWYVTEGPRGKGLPRWASNILVLLAAANIVRDAMGHSDDLVGVLARFVLLLTLIKLYDRKKGRDYAQLLSLSLLLMLTGSVVSMDLLFGACVVIYAVLGLYVVLLLQLFVAHEHQAEHAKEVSRGLAPAHRPVTGRNVRRQFRSMAIVIGAAGLFVSGAIFVFFPRELGRDSLIKLPGLVKRYQTGFSENIHLAANSRINDSMRQIMHVTVRDEQGRDVRLDGPLLLRGAVLDRYDGNGSWRSSGENSGTRIDLNGQSPSFVPLLHRRNQVSPDQVTSMLDETSLTFMMDSFVRMDRVFSPQTAAAVRSDNHLPLRYDPVTQEILIDGDPIRTTYEVQTIESPSDQAMVVLAEPPTPGRQMRQRLSHVRIEKLARTLLRDAGVAQTPPMGRSIRQYNRYEWNKAAATIFLQYLTSPEFEYTLALDEITLEADSSGKIVDPVINFLFNAKRGHCEYFASAFAALCSNIGIESRVVTGYATVNYDEVERVYRVLDANAHAWAEVRTGRQSWTTYDPTPLRVFQEVASPTSGLATQIRTIYDQLDTTWSSNIIEFDSESQSRLARSVDLGFSTLFRSATDTVKEWMAAVNRSFSLGPSGYIFLALVGLVVIIAALAIWSFVHRRRLIRKLLHLRGERSVQTKRMVRQLGFYLDMFTLLRKAGHNRPDWMAPRQFATVLAGQNPQCGEIVDELTSRFYEVRFGGVDISRDDALLIQERLRDLADQLGVRRP